MYKIIRKVEDDESVVANHVLNKETAKQLLMNDVYNHIENRGCRRIVSKHDGCERNMLRNEEGIQYLLTVKEDFVKLHEKDGLIIYWNLVAE